MNDLGDGGPLADVEVDHDVGEPLPPWAWALLLGAALGVLLVTIWILS